MGGKASHKNGEGKGSWFQIKCVKDIVRDKEARGEDAEFERKLLKSWSRLKGWEDARM